MNTQATTRPVRIRMTHETARWIEEKILSEARKVAREEEDASLLDEVEAAQDLFCYRRMEPMLEIYPENGEHLASAEWLASEIGKWEWLHPAHRKPLRRVQRELEGVGGG